MSSQMQRLTPELIAALKRLKLGPIADTLPERLVLADKQDMSFEDLLLLILSDEISRRDIHPRYQHLEVRNPVRCAPGRRASSSGHATIRR